MLILALILAFGIGLSLGVLGSGGSIVTLPVLVYVAGMPVATAVAMSLAIVGGTAVVGGWWKQRQGLVHWRAAALFGLSGIPGALAGAQFTRFVPPAVLMLSFAGLMLLIAVKMLTQRDHGGPEPLPDCRPARCVTAGLGVGGLTGFLGVGGGFLLVPAMMHFGRLPMPVAVGTSLVVIAVNSFAGLAGHLRHGAPAAGMTLAFLGAALLGMFAGARFFGGISARKLRHVFGGFVLLVAGLILAKNWPDLMRLFSSNQP